MPVPPPLLLRLASSPACPRILICHRLLMFHDPDPFSDLFPTFFNPPTIVISIPDVFSGITAGIHPSSSSTQPPQTTQAPSTSSASSSQQTTPSEPSRPPIRTPLDTVRTSTHSPVSLPSSSSSTTVDATTVVFNVTNILTETSLLTAPASPSATAASLRSDVHTLPGGAIAGIVVAILSGAAVVCLALLLLYRRRRTKQRQERAIPHPSSPLLFRCAGPGAQSPGPQPLRDKPPGTRPPPLQIVESRAADTRPRESVVDMSYVSDDHLPLMNAGLSSPTTPRRVTCRERDGGRVHPSLYLDTSAEQYAGQSVEYLPPAYEDLPSPMSPVTTTPMTHG
ncbi:hypothetical protein OH76DRAFT_227114 [Lentinus brumalis]|uniref:Mid2 domain-containing protein n=1 Tax=Lentinus brumalis TaxID=2498619 RepID=A0A371DHB4_9APHY|nr:hypothetical protein OH76DRAFT_227114 [Polyporus brumalis]